MRPPFSFWSCPKRERAAPGVREKGALAATLHMRAKLLYGGRRIGASADLALPPDTLGSSARSILPSRGGWCGGHRGARTHLTSSSFRAFRFATRCPGGRRSCCVGSYCNSHQQPASGSEKRIWMYPRLPRAGGFPQGPGVSVPDRRKGQPTIPRRRQEVCACADRPAEAFFLFGPCTARFSFGKTKREMGGASAQPSAWPPFPRPMGRTSTSPCGISPHQTFPL